MNDMNKILEELNNFHDLSETNIIERTKAVLKKEDPNKYKEWKEDKFNPDHLFKLGRNRVGTLLHLACWCNDERIVKLLIDTRVIDVNKQGGDRKISPLMVAADRSSQSIVKRLLKAGADPHVINDGFYNSAIYEYSLGKRARIHANTIIQFILLLNPQEDELYAFYLDDEVKQASKSGRKWFADEFVDEIVDIFYWHDCKDAAQKMQSEDPLLREFLLEIDEIKLAGYLNNPVVRTELKKGQYQEEYPLYADMIKSQYNKGMKARELLNKGINAIQYCAAEAGVNLPNDQSRRLVESLYDQLTDVDLRHLIKATRPKIDGTLIEVDLRHLMKETGQKID